MGGFGDKATTSTKATAGLCKTNEINMKTEKTGETVKIRSSIFSNYWRLVLSSKAS